MRNWVRIKESRAAQVSPIGADYVKLDAGEKRESRKWKWRIKGSRQEVEQDTDWFTTVEVKNEKHSEENPSMCGALCVLVRKVTFTATNYW